MTEEPSPAQRLEHRLRNLLGTIRAQLEVARAVPGEEAPRRALELIERSADQAEAELRALRPTLRGD